MAMGSLNSASLLLTFASHHRRVCSVGVCVMCRQCKFGDLYCDSDLYFAIRNCEIRLVYINAK